MKLYFFDGKLREFRVGNFGDDLNPWLWDRLLPDWFDDQAQTLFVGIGTLLNNRLPQDAQKIIFGSGVGYGTAIPAVDARWNVYCVRGNLSAHALGLEASVSVTDPAILVRKFWEPNPSKQFKRAYMPHYHEEVFNGAAWKDLCESLSIYYINPTQPIEQVLSEIASTEVLFTEAMHGAIIADALRVPWVAVKTHKNILEFKWNDWLSPYHLTYEPFMIHRFASRPGKKGILRYCDYQFIRLQMQYMVQTAKPSLSALSKLQELEERLMDKLEELKADRVKGLFC